MEIAKGRKFLIQLFAAGFFRRVVQIIAILGLLSLNDYFTTPAQIPTLLPIGACIILLLVLVSTADSVSSKVCDKLVKRLERIQQIYNISDLDKGIKANPSQQRYYLRNVFFPLLIAVPPAPVLVIVLISSTPLLFIVSIIQGFVNSLIVWRYNRAHHHHDQYPSELDKYHQFSEDYQAHLLTRSEVDLGQAGTLVNLRHDQVEESVYLHSKRDAIRMSNLVFRGIILVTSTVLAIYKLSSLASVVGFFILNNTLRYSVITAAEYLWPSSKSLSFQQACQIVDRAFQPDSFFAETIVQQHLILDQRRSEFSQRMSQRLAAKPYLRFRDFNLLQLEPSPRTLLKDITARLELLPITCIHVHGLSLTKSIALLCADQLSNRVPIDCKGTVVCGQLNVDLSFWRGLPIADIRRNRLVSTNLSDHFPNKHQSHLLALIVNYEIKKLYLEDDQDLKTINHMSRRQVRRMSSLISLFDAILNPSSLWLLPFVLDPFDDVESSKLLHLFRQEASHEQRNIFLNSRPIADFQGAHACYELRSSSLKRTV